MSEIQTPDYTQIPEGLLPFPNAEDVFVADQSELAHHLHALFSIDLSKVNPQWSGVAHMLSPLEPYECFVGELTEWNGYHGDLLKTNWIGFQIEQGRYRLCGDPRYFFLHEGNAELADPHPGARADLQQHYAEQHSAFAAAAEGFKRSGRLARMDWDSTHPIEFVQQLGGDVDGRANWVESVEFPMDIVDTNVDEGDSNVYPLSPAGHRFYHVASVPGWHYRSAGADLIVMFYEPVEGLVLFTFDYS
ncbi:hypothetical protein [Pseudomonas sp. GM80]|uniref:hypothetical protein n=1 Tax=Pseudomonas sp. GM80 TaxID=1144339 RepID=UPI00026FD1CF|nr:hypothetical protein [Pseudomonas sp. GM80]EJN23193.1 hypothetical protein PMI37_04760 [Pseudomonas sp. GM80]